MSEKWYLEKKKKVWKCTEPLSLKGTKLVQDAAFENIKFLNYQIHINEGDLGLQGVFFGDVFGGLFPHVFFRIVGDVNMTSP